MMLGKRTHVRWRQRDIGALTADITVYSNDTVNVTNLERTEEHYEGKVWCPTTGTGMWIARRNGITFHTGNCFPEFHPHDRSRLIRFKLKYRFWGTSTEGTRQVYCVDDTTEALTKDGWKHHSEINIGDELLTLNPNTKNLEWQPALSIHIFDYEGEMIHWENSHGFDALTTPNHRWLTAHRDRDGNDVLGVPGRFMLTEELSGSNKSIIAAGTTSSAFPTTPTYSDEFVELIGWVVTEGHYQKSPSKTGVLVSQSESANPEKVERIRTLVRHYSDQGATATEQRSNRKSPYESIRDFYFGSGIGNLIRQVAPDKHLTPEFICSLTLSQANLLYETMLDGDGHRSSLKNHDGHTRTVQTENFIQNKGQLVSDFQMLSTLLGNRVASKQHAAHPKILNTVSYNSKVVTARHLKDNRINYEGIVWCPKTENQTWVARRNNSVYVTGNTYTEILTDDRIEEYINDEQIDSRPNPIGVVPVIHIPNTRVSGSPWGLPDCHDMIVLNRNYNEVATDIADIVNYHAAPVTIITGAKASQLEKGPKKVWGGLPKDAQVFNLEGGGQGLQGAMEYLAIIKTAMHEMVGVPESALGQIQPISNTSGVALAIQFQPLMNRYQQKVIQYGEGIRRVNELILLTLAFKEPEVFIYNPVINGPIKPSQLDQLDLANPITYETQVHFPPPLPLDKIVILNEIQVKMDMGLESREGALRQLGEEFPDEKLEEIREELIRDAKADGALMLIRSQINAAITSLTGMTPEGEAPPGAAPGDGTGPGPSGQPGIITPMEKGVLEELQQVTVDLVTDAYGTKIPMQRTPDQDKPE